MNTQYLHYIHPCTPFRHILPPPTDTIPQARPALPSCSLIL
jgi:hypothetical protein